MTIAMILAAGRGERMRPLTDSTPKPLLKIAGKPIIEYHIERLVAAGYEKIIINTHYLADQIHTHLKSGEQFNIAIEYSNEQPEALETGGGIFQALPQLGDDFFCVINGDIFCDHDLKPPTFDTDMLAHLILVKNPQHNKNGDFGLDNALVTNKREYTFSGIGWYHPKLFSHCIAGKFPLAPILRRYADEHKISGKLHTGAWIDIGTPERLSQINQHL